MHVPNGFGVVTPYILVKDADRYVRFLVAGFGAREVGRSTDPDGRVANCQMRFDDMTIMVSEASAQFPASKAAFCLYVADVEAVMATAADAGAEKVMDVADMPYGDRQGGVRDPAGNIWWVSQRTTSAPYF